MNTIAGRIFLCGLVLLMGSQVQAEAAGDCRQPPAGCDGAARLITYPGPPDISPSPLYSVRVSQSGRLAGSFVYQVNNIGLAPYNWQGHGWNIRSELTTAWTSFDFRDPGATSSSRGAAPITVQVNMAVPSPAWQQPAVRVLPSTAGIVPGAVTRAGNAYQATFTLSAPTQYSVEFYDAATHPDFSTWIPPNPLLIFANAIEDRVPDTADKHVLVLRPGEPIPVSGAWGKRDGVAVSTLYFSPGVYDLGRVPSSVNAGIYQLHSNQHVYLAGGAYVKGAFVTCPNTSPAEPCSDAINVSIRGRGVLSGEIFKRDYTVDMTNANAIANDAPMLIDFEGSHVADGMYAGQQNGIVEGITLIQAPYYNIQMSGINNRVSGIKLISWYPSTDGVAVGYDYRIEGVEYPGNGVIEDSFFKDGDDSVKLYSSGLRVHDVVVWQSNNAAAFQLSTNMSYDVDDVRASHSQVIHSEWNWPNMGNAVFAGHQGGRGLLGQAAGYRFEDIHVENSGWQLMQLAVGPSIWEFGNTQLGSVSNLHFKNIVAADTQTLPNEFQSYDLQHRLSGVTFDNVVVAGKPLSDPAITFDANRMNSLTGNTMSSPMWADRTPSVSPNVQIWKMVQGTPSASPISAIESLNVARLDNPAARVVGYGDFFADGYASPLIFGSNGRTLGVWREPLNPALAPQSSGYFVLCALPPGYEFAAVGDFNDSAATGVLLWNADAQDGVVLEMNGASQLIPVMHVQPGHPSSWSVAGIGDFDKNGYSDVLLRDTSGNLEVLYLGPAGILAILDIAPRELFYAATSEYQRTNPQQPSDGHFDASWQVAGVGTFLNGYAGIIWRKPATGDVGLSQFSPVVPQKPISGTVIASLPLGSEIQGFGDYNGDGALDILFRDTNTGQVGIWYLGWMGGSYYRAAQVISPALGAAWQLLGD